MPQRFKSITWPYVTLVGLAFAAVVALHLWGADRPGTQGTTLAILAIVGPLVAASYMGGRVDEVNDKLDSVEHKVNGNLSKLVAKVEPAAGGVDVLAVDDTGHTVGHIVGGQVRMIADPPDDPAPAPVKRSGARRRVG